MKGSSLLFAAALAACSPAPPHEHPMDPVSPTGNEQHPDLGTSSPAPDLAVPGDAGPSGPDLAGMSGLAAITSVWTIVLENHDYNEIVGSTNAPYLNGLIAQGGLATNYQDSGSHPSLPNYLYLVSGDIQYPGYVDLNPTQSFVTGTFPVKADNLGAQLQAAVIPWRSYQESMGTPCALAPNSNHYAPKHDPFLYFDNVQNGAAGLCASTQVDYGAFAADLAAGTYRYLWITPNLVDDGHDPNATPADVITGLKQSDAWCATEVPKILASAAYQAGGAIFITWDEAEGRSGNSTEQVPMIVVSPRIVSAGYQSKTAFTHASYLATVEDIFHLPRLGAAKSATSLAEFFK
jgi:hypothetical protein